MSRIVSSKQLSDYPDPSELLRLLRTLRTTPNTPNYSEHSEHSKHSEYSELLRTTPITPNYSEYSDYPLPITPHTVSIIFSTPSFSAIYSRRCCIDTDRMPLCISARCSRA